MTQLTAPETTSLRPVDTTPPPPAQPSRKRARLVGVDAARGVSLLGMITLHALYEADAAGRPTWSSLAFSGKAAAAFALLAGVGVTFATGRRPVRRADARPTVAMLAVRALVIGVVGMFLSGADTLLDSVILPYLAVVFLLAIPLVFLPTWAVVVIGVALATAGPAAHHLLLPQLPEPSLANPTFARLADDPVGMLTELSLTGFYPAPAWLAYMCAGVVIGRLDLTRAKVAAVLLAGGTVLAVAAKVASWLLLHRYGGLTKIWAAQPTSGLTVDETTELLTFGGNGSTPSSTWWWLAVDSPHTSTPFDLLNTTGIAVAVLGILLLAGHVTPRVLRQLITVVLVSLAAAGSMTLTFYTAHVLFINSDFDTYSATTGCLVQLIAVLLLAPAWKATAGRGPLEAIVIALATRARRRAASRWPAAVTIPAQRVKAAAVPPTVRLKEVAPASAAHVEAAATHSAARDASTPVDRPATTMAAHASALRELRTARRRRDKRRPTRHRVRLGVPPPWIVSDALWRRVEPLLPEAERPQRNPRRKRVGDRQVLCGILFVLHTGVRWESLPPELGLGSGAACRRRLVRWQAKGVWARIHEVLLAEVPGAEQLHWSRITADARLLPAGRSTGLPAAPPTGVSAGASARPPAGRE